ncbi:ATP-binding cassette domain-containing protein [Labrys monachus]|uniref:Ribose transport system ATP-binding protein n=1 Tax=Labrys monachus TaxID=217067 RepID=A0ABU0F7E7_9HYPH|nr:ATP-binding cassette domain-containing protein [Labrys monachus]MDQ0390536.1 ribose transport system ATP-binding protein [Labrys monachus]
MMTASPLPAADPKPSFAPRAGEGVIALGGITKAFGPTVANADVSLHIARGDVLGLVGGNGAGKSTLMRILCGVFRPDSGTLNVDGRPVPFDGFDARAAQDAGIRIVHQELSLCSNLTVAENFFLEAPEAARYRPGWREVYRRRARAALDAVFPDNGINVHRRVEALPIGERQMVEIARAVATPGVRLVILDEPTSSLGLERSRQLRAYVHEKAAAGLSFIFISHKLFEIIDVASVVAVLRNGRMVWHGEASGVAVHDLVTLMGGVAAEAESAGARAGADGEVMVRVKGEVAALLGHEVELRRGQIVGLAGLEGSGQKELLHRLFAPGRGDAATLECRGKASFVSGDRQKEGVFPLWTVLANIGLGRIVGRAPLAWISDAAERAAMQPVTDRLQLDAGRLRSGILDLSGGNQQKALVARALVTDAPIVLLDDPTRGVDVAAKQDFYALARAMADNGRLVVWYSTEDLEFLQCDRVLVFAQGRIVSELERGAISEKAIVDASFTALEAGTPGGRPRAGSRDAGASWAGRLVELAPFATLALVFAAMILANPATASVFGLDLLLSPAVPLVLVALGQMFIVGGSEIDLGIGAFAGLVNVISATVLFDDPAYGVLALAGAALAYPVLGLLIQMRRIPAIVVTLGASFIWMGVAYTMQPTPGGASPDWLSALVGWSIPGVPTSLVILLVAGLCALVVDRTPLGVALRAFGNNPLAMARCGWPAARYGALRYFIAGLFAIAAGLSLTAINTASDYNSGGTYTLLSVAAVVIGGCSLIGGSISSMGVIAGSVTLALIGALLGMMNVPSDFTAAVQGVLLLAILALRAAVAGGRDEE